MSRQEQDVLRQFQKTQAATVIAPLQPHAPEWESVNDDMRPILEYAKTAAAMQVVDIRQQWEGLKDACREPLMRYLGSETEPNDPPDIPLVSEPRIGLPGWWRLTNTTSCLVRQADDDYFSCHFLMVDAAGDVSICVGEGGITIGDSGWSTEVVDNTSSEVMVSPERTNEEQDVVGQIRAQLIQAMCVVLLTCSIAQLDPGVVKRERASLGQLRKAKRGGILRHHTPVTIELPNLRYEKGNWHSQTRAGVAWHAVRGHWRTLYSDRYRKKGARVWVRSHSRGRKELGTRGHIYEVAR